jgi:hypothetical protein
MSAAANASLAVRHDADSTTAWDSLMAALHAAKAADEEINRRYDAASAACTADTPAEPDVDTALIFGNFLSRHVDRRRLIYSQDLDELQRQIIAAKGVTLWEKVDRNPDRIAELNKVREFRRLLAEAEQRHNISALDDESGAAGDRLSNTRAALLLAPAPGYSAVRWKLDQLFGPEATGPIGDDERSIPCWNCEFTDAVIADMERLGGAS